MTLQRVMHSTVLAVAMLALASLCLASDSFVFLACSLVLAVTSEVLGQGSRPRRVPRAVAHLAIGVLACGSLGLVFLEGRPPEASEIGLICAAALLVKLFARHRAADERQILALGVMVLLVAGVEATDLLAGLPLVIATLILPMALAAVRVQEVSERLAMPSDAQRADRRPILATEGVDGGSPLRCWILFGTTSVVLTAVTAAGVFVLFPRRDLDGEGWSRSRTAGFSMAISLTAHGRLEDKRTEVLTMRWIGPDGIAVKDSRPLHLRGAVFNQYNPASRSWVDTPLPQRAHYEGMGEPFEWFAPGQIDDRQQVYRQVVQMRGLATTQLFSSLTPIGVQAPLGVPLTLDQSSLILTTARIGEFDRYAVAVKPHATDRDMQLVAGGAIEPAGELPTFPVPEIEPIAAALLAQWGPVARPIPTREEALASPAVRWERNRVIARSLESALLSGAFQYTTDLRSITRRPRIDPIVQFLTTDRLGHCEYFASALCAMCQSLGVDARVVAGFIAIEFDEAQSQYIVRSSNAHAWVEVRTGDAQWSLVDGTPPATLEALQAEQRSWADGLRWLWDPLNFAWARHVASFDEDTQAQLGRSASTAREWLARPIIVLRGALVGAKLRLSETFSSAVGLLWIASIGGVLLAAGIAGSMVHARRRRTTRLLGRRGTRAERELARLYLEGLDLCARHGVRRAPGMSAMDVADALGARAPLAARHLRSIAFEFYCVRFGRSTATLARCAAAAAALEGLQREVPR